MVRSNVPFDYGGFQMCATAICNLIITGNLDVRFPSPKASSDFENRYIEEIFDSNPPVRYHSLIALYRSDVRRCIMNRLNISLMRLFILVLLIGCWVPGQQSSASTIVSNNYIVNVSSAQSSYVVVAFEVFGTRYYHYRDFDTSNLDSPDAQRYLKNVIRYDRYVLRDRNVSDDDIKILQYWGFTSRGEAANLACNLERQGFQVWSTSACYTMPAQPTAPYEPAQPIQPAPVQPAQPEQPAVPREYRNDPATLAGRIIKSSQSPGVNETVRFQVEASDSSDLYAALSFNWFIDGQPVVQANGYGAYDAPTLDWTFATGGSHSIAVTVTNRYSGASTQLKENVGVIEFGRPIDGERETSPGLIDTDPSVNPLVVIVVGGIVVLLGISVIFALLKSLFFRVAK
jgi:hypothetical protein